MQDPNEYEPYPPADSQEPSRPGLTGWTIALVLALIFIAVCCIAVLAWLVFSFPASMGYGPGIH